MRPVLGLLLLAAMLPAAAVAMEETAPAPSPAPDPAAHRHLGFFIRPEVGYAWLAANTSFQGSKIELTGNGASIALSVGSAITEDLILAATGWHFFVSSPELKVDGASLGSASGSSAGLVGYGLAITWYARPSNFYLSINPALTQLVATDGRGNSLTSDLGPGLRAAAGREWWVSAHWGVGLAASVTICRNGAPEALAGAAWRSTTLNLSLSATYN